MQRMRPVLDWLGTVAFLIAFVLILGTFEILLRLSYLFGKRAVERVGGGLQTALVWSYRLAGIRMDLEKSDKVVDGEPYVILSNHQSMFDIPLFAWALPRSKPRYISKRELGRRIPAVSFNLRHGGHILIDRGDRIGAVALIRQLGEKVVREGCSAVIFPEGTRARQGEIAPFKIAGTLALLEGAKNIPLVPVCIDNSWRVLMYRLFPIPFGIRLRIWIGDPIERREGDDPTRVIAEAERRIRQTLARFRAEEAPQTSLVKGASG